MGTTCCRQDAEFEIQSVERPDTILTLAPGEEVNERCANPGSNCTNSLSPTKYSTTESLSRYLDYTDQIMKIQALFRGAVVRKALHVGTLLKPHGIIRYITGQMRCVPGAKAAISMEPFEVEWNLEDYKGKLELRKIVTDSKENTYAGYWNVKNNTKEGYGQELYANGAKYEGFWLNNEYEGKGRLVHENGDFYAGMWKSGKAEGFGTFVGVDGMKYIGEWKAGEHHGKGKEIWTDGSVFEGTYVNGEKEGFGKFVWIDKSYYEGYFSKSMMNGEGSPFFVVFFRIRTEKKATPKS